MPGGAPNTAHYAAEVEALLGQGRGTASTSQLPDQPAVSHSDKELVEAAGPSRRAGLGLRFVIAGLIVAVLTLAVLGALQDAETRGPCGTGLRRSGLAASGCRRQKPNPATVATLAVLQDSVSQLQGTPLASGGQGASSEALGSRQNHVPKPARVGGTRPIALADDSAALSCSEYAIVYRPLDMNGGAPSIESSIASCQERCGRTDSCAHYSYYMPSGHCHLQDAFSYPTYNNLYWISGPSGCSADEQSPEIITILMYKKVCYEADTAYYVLDMEDITPAWAHSVLECQRRCRYQPFCAHFTYDSIDGTCHLETASARPVRNPRSGYISGPPVCQVPKEKLLEISRQRSAALCSKPGEDCTESRCCSDPSVQCYEQDGGRAACKATCTSGSNQTGAAPSCKPLYPHSHSWVPRPPKALPSTAQPATTPHPPRPVRTTARPGPWLTTAKPAAQPTGACAAPSDQAAWQGGVTFEVDMHSCAPGCLGASYCTSKCMAKKRGYTGPCSKCFGEAAACTVKSCLFQCMAGAESSGCRACSKQNCRPTFAKCSGLSPPHEPHS